MRPLTMRMRNLSLLATLALQLPLAASHSWVEQLRLIAANGTFTGAAGFPRGNVLRSSPGFSDPTMVHLIGPTVKPTDSMCMSSQQNPVQTSGSPRLQAAPGAMIALEYQENGHVTLPDNQKGKPANRGTVYIYGTTDGKPSDTLASIHKVWNADGSGGDKRGKLLASQAFDDGQCYQINGGPISTARQKEFPHAVNPVQGADVWCQNDIKLPTDAPTGKPYTLYWVWDWPTAAGVDPGLPLGKQEIYTTCMDVDIVAASTNKNKAVVQQKQGQAQAAAIPIGNGAVPAYFDSLKAGGDGSNAPAASSAAPAPAVTSAAPVAAPPSQGHAGSGCGAPPSQGGQSPAQSAAQSLAQSIAKSAANAAASQQAPVPVTQTVFQTVYVTPTPQSTPPARFKQTQVNVVYQTVTVTASADDTADATPLPLPNPDSPADDGTPSTSTSTVYETSTSLVTMTKAPSMTTKAKPTATGPSSSTSTTPQGLADAIAGENNGNSTTVVRPSLERRVMRDSAKFRAWW